jgi:redox-sensitive bicupin YhaK (pirin superfamily)
MHMQEDLNGVAYVLAQRTRYAAHDRFERWLQIVDSNRASEDASVHVSRINPSTRCMPYRFKPGRGSYIYVVEGDTQVNSEHMQKRDAGRVTGAGLVNIEPSQPTELLIVDVRI